METCRVAELSLTTSALEALVMTLEAAAIVLRATTATATSVGMLPTRFVFPHTVFTLSKRSHGQQEIINLSKGHTRSFSA